MAAERKEASEAPRRDYLTLVALYEQEGRANELLERLAALNIDTSEATIVRVAVGAGWPQAWPMPSAKAAPLSRLARYAVTGAIIGAAAALLIGAALYETGIWQLPFSTSLFFSAFISALIGAVLGAALGAVTAAIRKVTVPAPVPPAPGAANDGFLVVVKTPPRLAEQAETIARRLGAKEILL
jgi:hypothetical protein